MKSNWDYGRIRLGRTHALYLDALLHEKRHRLVIRRADAKANGQDVSDYQAEIAFLDHIADELNRLLVDKSW